MNKREGLSKEKIDQIIRLSKAGKSLPEIRKEVGCSYNTARRYTELYSKEIKEFQEEQEKESERQLEEYFRIEQARNARMLHNTEVLLERCIDNLMKEDNSPADVVTKLHKELRSTMLAQTRAAKGE